MEEICSVCGDGPFKNRDDWHKHSCEEFFEKKHLTTDSDAGAKLACSDGLSGTIPLLRGKPEITNDMKRYCIGEFRFDIDATCTACFYDEPQEDCEVCAGEVQYTESVEVPWDLIKDIYKRMAAVAMGATYAKLRGLSERSERKSKE